MLGIIFHTVKCFTSYNQKSCLGRWGVYPRTIATKLTGQRMERINAPSEHQSFMRICLLCLFVVFVICACDLQRRDPVAWDQGAAKVAVIIVTPHTVHLAVDQTQKLFAMIGDAAGNILPVRMVKSSLELSQANQVTTVIGDSMGRTGHIVSWNSSKPNLVTIDTNGLLKAVAPGEATITANCEGQVAKAKVVVAGSIPNSMSVIPEYAGLSVGETLQLKAVQQNANGKDSVEHTAWYTDQPSLATVTQQGFVKAKKAGKVTITAKRGKLKTSVAVEIVPVEKIHGLDFPGCAGVHTTMRFEFTEPLAAYPATYIWRAYPRQQQSYYTTFFWGNNGKFYPSNTYYGFHPYPDWNTSYQHFWEIAASPGGDFTSSMHVIYNRWYIQVAVCRQTENTREIEFYWDWPDAAKVIKYTGKPFGDPPSPGLIVGDAPWNQGNEVWNGVLRGFQFYNIALTTDEISKEIDSPGTIYRPWYLNLNPSPKDIFDKSGSANHPEWVGTERPWQWNGELHRDIIFSASNSL